MSAPEVMRVFHLHRLLLLIYEPSEAETWLVTPATFLGGKRPCEVIATPEGYGAVEAFVRQITDGAYT